MARGPRRVLRSGSQLLAEHVHQEPVVPGAVGAALVTTHDPDPAESDLLVGPDRRRVVGRRVYGQPVVAAPLEEVAREHPDRLGAQPSAVAGRGEEDVDVRVAVHRIVLLAVLDPPHDLPVDLDDEALVASHEAVPDLLLGIAAAPPPGDLGLLPDADQRVGVPRTAGAQQHALSSQHYHAVWTLLSGTTRHARTVGR